MAPKSEEETVIYDSIMRINRALGEAGGAPGQPYQTLLPREVSRGVLPAGFTPTLALPDALHGRSLLQPGKAPMMPVESPASFGMGRLPSEEEKAPQSLTELTLEHATASFHSAKMSLDAAMLDRTGQQVRQEMSYTNSTVPYPALNSNQS